MTAKHRRHHSSKVKRLGTLHRFARGSAQVVGKTFVTIGDLVAAAYEVGGSAAEVALLLSPPSPLPNLLNRHIVVA